MRQYIIVRFDRCGYKLYSNGIGLFYNELKCSCNLTYLNGVSGMQIGVSKGGDLEYLFSFPICSTVMARATWYLPLVLGEWIASKTRTVLVVLAVSWWTTTTSSVCCGTGTGTSGCTWWVCC